ncbi:MAG: TRAM domain-containing protein [Candidatus Omnitrophica bacterium]|nr:TRAM domain-containing protein [Candidatus Omnitrophota bacterium]
MTFIFIRLFFIAMSGVAGYQLGLSISNLDVSTAWTGAAIGLGTGVVIAGVEVLLRPIYVRGLSAAVFGLLFGLIMAKIVTGVFLLVPMSDMVGQSVQLAFTIVFCYLGMMMALRSKDEFSVIIPYVKFEQQGKSEEFVLLDTSVIIDGRIADIAKTSFIDSKFVIPRFVLRELQQIADSQDSLKRNRGRRGLDALNKIQKSSNLDVRIHDEDFPEVHEVDAKLVKLAKKIQAKIFTNDYNLNKVAELQGVTVLNINELANALKPVVLPGEVMDVRLVKEGKEYNQAVAYLDDGTMVVVEGARRLIGQKVEVEVTSVIQTAAGRMIFAKLASQQQATEKV